MSAVISARRKSPNVMSTGRAVVERPDAHVEHVLGRLRRLVRQAAARGPDGSRRPAARPVPPVAIRIRSRVRAIVDGEKASKTAATRIAPARVRLERCLQVRGVGREPLPDAVVPVWPMASRNAPRLPVARPNWAARLAEDRLRASS